MIVIGLLRIISTYDVFWQTWDEPAHVAAGMEWLEKGRYEYENFQPPLTRVMIALGLFADGTRGTGDASIWAEGESILLSNDQYERNLTLARLGVLPFFVLASYVVASWARRFDTMLAPLVSVLLFTTLPPILAHAGVATVDMGSAATLALALFVLDEWLNKPSLLCSGLLGAAAGLAILAKFPALAIIPAGAACMGFLYGCGYLMRNLKHPSYSIRMQRRIVGGAVGLAIALLVVWAGYRFSVQWIEAENRPHSIVDRFVGPAGSVHDVAYAVLENTPILAPEFVYGLIGFVSRNEQGHTVYFLGNVRTYGWWYYFPVVLAVKTPLPVLLLCVCSLFFLCRDIKTGKKGLRIVSPLVFLIVMLAISSQSQVNNGTRQVLFVYPLLAVLSGYSAAQLIALKGRLQVLARGLVFGLLLWQVISSVAAHPDYIAYFNEFARSRPEEIVVDSDLDWGQDLKRLVRTLHRRDISDLRVKYNGSAFVSNPQFGLPSFKELEPYERVDGWIAISVFHLKTGTQVAPYDQFAWLNEYEPAERAGRSILLYNLSAEAR